MRGALKGRALLLTGIAAVLAGTLLGFFFGAPIGRGVSVVAETLARSVGWRTTGRPEVLSLPGNEMAKDAPSTTQSLTGFDELSYAVYELVGGRRTNFQNVKTFPKNSLIRQLANGVGSLRIKFKGQDDSHACTAFVITDKPGATYALTAGHCFYQDGVCPTAKETSSKAPPAIDRMYLVFNQFENRQLIQNDETNPNAIPATLARNAENKLELNCGNVDSSDKSKPYVDYAIIRLDDAKFQAHRTLSADNQIAPVSLGVVPIEPRHQLLILSQPDGRALMATERNCLATERPDQPNGSFAHYCDTLKGSSGAPVFSRDHAVVAGLHTRSQYNPFAAGEENIAIPIETIANASPLLQSLNILLKDPLTAEQQKLVDYANLKAADARSYLQSGNATLSAYVALAGLDRIVDASGQNAVSLLKQASAGTSALADSIGNQTERVRILASSNYPVEDAQYTTDERAIVVTSQDPDRRVSLWSRTTGKLLAANTTGMRHIQPLPNGNFVSLAEDGAATDITLHLLEKDTLRSLSQLVIKSFGIGTTTFVDQALPPSLIIGVGPQGQMVGRIISVKDNQLIDTHSSITLGADRNAFAISPDQTELAVGTSTGLLQYFDMRSGRILRKLQSHTSSITSVSFNSNGTFLLTTSKDGSAKLWHKDEQRPRVTIKSDPSGEYIYGAPATSNGKIFLCQKSSCSLWDANGQQKLGESASITWPVSFNRSDTRILSSKGVWDGNTLVPIATFQANDFAGATFSPTGEKIIVGNGDGIFGEKNGTASILNSDTGKPATGPLLHEAFVMSARFNKNGTSALTSSYDGTVREWHTAPTKTPDLVIDGSLYVELYPADSQSTWPSPSGADTSQLDSLIANSSGDRLLTSRGSKVQLWNTISKKLMRQYSHFKSKPGLNFSSEGSVVLFDGGCNEDSPCVLDDGSDAPRSNPSITFIDADSGVVRSTQELQSDSNWTMSADNSTIAVADGAGNLQILQAANGALISKFRVERKPTQIGLNMHGNILVVVVPSKDGTGSVVVHFNRELNTQNAGKLPSATNIQSVIVSPDGKDAILVMAGTQQRSPKLAKIELHSPFKDSIKYVWNREASCPKSTGFIPFADSQVSWQAGRILSSCAAIGNGALRAKVQLLDLNDARVLLTTSNQGGTSGAKFSPRGERFVTMDRSNAYLWDSINGFRIGNAIHLQNSIRTVVFSADSFVVSSAGAEERPRIWSLKTGEPLSHTPWPSTEVASLLEMSVDGRRMFTEHSGVIKRWTVNQPSELCLMQTAYDALEKVPLLTNECSQAGLSCRSIRHKDELCEPQHVK